MKTLQARMRGRHSVLLNSPIITSRRIGTVEVDVMRRRLKMNHSRKGMSSHDTKISTGSMRRHLLFLRAPVSFSEKQAPLLTLLRLIRLLRTPARSLLRLLQIGNQNAGNYTVGKIRVSSVCQKYCLRIRQRTDILTGGERLPPYQHIEKTLYHAAIALGIFGYY